MMVDELNGFGRFPQIPMTIGTFVFSATNEGLSTNFDMPAHAEPNHTAPSWSIAIDWTSIDSSSSDAT